VCFIKVLSFINRLKEEEYHYYVISKQGISNSLSKKESQHRLEKGKRRCLMLIICTAAITTCFMMAIGTNLCAIGVVIPFFLLLKKKTYKIDVI